ncbi:F-box C protein [Caenorhabditis elegans]|nr:F-box C protein [Caenorhabditis elegans]CUV67080.1 F-box C protein [Caenorhabditis elegans]|eukprot:NP_001305227.1 F-box C protein [Caenorhabditis elegans]
MHIERLDISEFGVEINRTSYAFQVKTDEEIDQTFDVDEFGMIDYDLVVDQNPDTILLDNRDPSNMHLELSYELQLLQNEYDRIEGLNGNDGIEDIEGLAKAREALEKRKTRYQFKYLKLMAREMGIKSQISIAREPLDQHIRFSINSPDRVPLYEEHLAYNKKIHEAQRSLLEKLFVGRPTICVKSLFIDSCFIVCIPKNMQFKVKHLSLSCNNFDEDLNAIRPLLHVSSFPLESIEVYGKWDSLDPILKTCGVLYFPGGCKIEKLLKLQNFHRKVHVNIFDALKQLPPSVKSWLENRQEIGTEYTFDISNEDQIILFLDEMKESNADRIVDEAELHVKLRMDNSTELYISYDPARDNVGRMKMKFQVQ